MNYKHVFSGVLTGLLLLNSSSAFGHDGGPNCNTTPDLASSRTPVTSGLIVKVANSTSRPVVVYVATQNRANNWAAYTDLVGMSDNQAYALPTHNGDTQISLSAGGSLSNSGSVVLTQGQYVSVRSGASYCAGPKGDGLHEGSNKNSDPGDQGTFGFTITVDGVTGYFEMGGMGQYPHTYYQSSSQPNFINNYAPVFSNVNSLPMDGNGGYYDGNHQYPIGNVGAPSPEGPWLFTYNRPSSDFWMHEGVIKFVFNIPQRDQGVKYDACPSEYYAMGPLCYQVVYNTHGPDGGLDGGNDNLSYANNGSGQQGSVIQNDTINIIVNNKAGVDTVRSGLNNFQPNTYDVSAAN